MNLGLIKLLILLPFILALTYPQKYTKIQKVAFESVENVDGIVLYKPNKTAYSSDFIKNEYTIAGQYFVKYAKSRNLPLKQCRVLELEVYIVDIAIINDMRLFPVTTNVVPERWALYDPYLIQTSAIILTEHNASGVNSVLFAHELGHYWFDIYCINDIWSGTTESFAQSFQDFYTIKRFGRMY